MRIKQYLLSCALWAIAFMCFVFLAPAFAELEKVEEDELARTNASVYGTPVSTAVTPDEAKILENPEILSSTNSATNTELVLSPPINKAVEGIGLNLNIKGQETFMFHFGGSTTTLTGGITTVTPH